jgi:hypothetical protein
METILFEHEVSFSRILQAETIRSDEVEPPLHPASLIRRRLRCSSGHPFPLRSLSLSLDPLTRPSSSFARYNGTSERLTTPFSLRGGMGPPAQRKERRDREIDTNNTWETRRGGREAWLVLWFYFCICLDRKFGLVWRNKLVSPSSQIRERKRSAASGHHWSSFPLYLRCLPTTQV